MKYAIVISLLLLCAVLTAQEMMPFGDLRHSSVCTDGNLRLRWNDLSGGMYPQECWYNVNNGAWMQATVDNSAMTHAQALLPYQFGQTLRYRLRSEMSYMGESIAYMHPAYLGSDAFPPALNNMALIGTDAIGDSITVYAPMLDLTDSYIAATSTKFYSALANVSNSFPTLNSLTSYNIYLTTIMNVESASDSLAYAMVYSFNIPGVISSGLYRIGMDSEGTPSFARIGNIQSQVSGGKLYMACNIADLVNDPSFGPWPNQYNMLMFTSATIRVDLDLGTMQPSFGFGDNSSIGIIEFLDLHYNVPFNSLPQIAIMGNGTQMVNVQYDDPDGDFPLIAEFETEFGQIIPLIPSGLDFSQSVIFSTMLPAGVEYGVIRFSDNESDIVQLIWTIVSNEDPINTPPAIKITMPNPFR